MTRRFRLADAIIVLVLLATTLDPGIFFWRTVYQSNSRTSRTTSVEVQLRGCVADCAMRVVLYRGFETKVLTRQSDCYLGLAQAVWQAERVAVLVNGVYCNVLQTGYDLATGSPINVHALEPAIKAALTASYNLTPTTLSKHRGDALAWAGSDDGVWAFYRRQPAGLARLLRQRSGVSLR